MIALQTKAASDFTSRTRGSTKLFAGKKERGGKKVKETERKDLSGDLGASSDL